MILPFIISLATAVLLGFILIPLLKIMNFRQTVREDGPKSHYYKTGIPTMGGFIFIIPIIIVSFLFTDDPGATSAILTAMILFSLIGFSDDLLKIIRKRNEGLSIWQKTVFLLVVSTAYALYHVLYTGAGGEMFIPFTAMGKSIMIPEFIYVILLVIFLYSITNAVNLTDGVDGLAGGITSIVLIFFIIVAIVSGKPFDSEKITALAALAAVLGFLMFNAHPAKVFMGDTGSMALGGLIGVLSIQMKIPWVIIPAGIIYVIEALSAAIQVGHYKRTRKRIFKMAPIHHHYEMSGWSEKKIVTVFCAVTLAGCIAAYAVIGLF